MQPLQPVNPIQAAATSWNKTQNRFVFLLDTSINFNVYGYHFKMIEKISKKSELKNLMKFSKISTHFELISKR